MSNYVDVDADVDDDEEIDYDSIPSTNAQIVTSIQSLMSTDKVDEEEDFASYKARMKELLEQLLLKLEEDVDYQKNLEMQIDDLERDLRTKDKVIEKLAHQAKEAIDNCKLQTEEMADEMLAKLAGEVDSRSALEKLVLRLEAENARLRVRAGVGVGVGWG